MSPKTPLPGGGGEGLQQESIFSAVHEISRSFEMFTPKTSNPGGVGVKLFIDFLGSS